MDLDNQLAVEVLKALGRHGWYTAEPTVIFALFSNKISAEEKEKARLSYPRPQPPPLPVHYSPEKPKFKELTPETELADLCGPSFFMPFAILGLDHKWLESDSELWGEDQKYREMEEFVRNVKVRSLCVTSERGCGTITVQQILTRDDELRRKLLQGVEMSRKMHPDLTKTTLNNKNYW